MNLMILEIILFSIFGKAVIGTAIDTAGEHTQKIENSPPVNRIDLDYWLPPTSDAFTQSKEYPSFVRFARNPNDFIRFGRSGSSFVRFGRAGHVPRNDRTGRDDGFVRFGRSRSMDENARLKTQNFLRFGRYNDNNRIRFSGKRDGSGGMLRKLPENIEQLLNNMALQPQQLTKSMDHINDAGVQTIDDTIALDELYRNQEQANGNANESADDQ